MTLWNGQPFKNYWNKCSVEDRSVYLIKAGLENKVKSFQTWEEIETHEQAKLRDAFRGDMN